MLEEKFGLVFKNYGIVNLCLAQKTKIINSL